MVDFRFIILPDESILMLHHDIKPKFFIIFSPLLLYNHFMAEECHELSYCS